jgi:ketosteroid isomerase-like protein
VNPLALWLKVGVVTIVALFAGTEARVTGPISSARSAKPAPCSGPEYRQYDFWVGDWDAFDFDNPTTQVARTQVDRILDGCVLREDYQGTNGAEGQSFSVYDSSRGVWHQSWVTNRGKLLVIEGKFQAGEMVLSGVDYSASERPLVRGTWKPVGGGVRETAVTSTDGGKTWKPWFDIVFRPRSNASAPGDGDLVAALDTQYQAAVKKNDVAAMDRFLADGFVLVTGSGKTYTKADLLEEALSARMVYEHQEDTAQTVRVWGDAAVITAKLWEKGTENGKPFDYTVWFTDTYVRTAAGWRYVFGQSSLPLPKAPE